MESNNVLGEAKVGKLLWKYALPCVLSLLISALYNVVDQLFIGNSEIGYMGNVATTVVFPLTILILALSLLIGDGAAAFLSLCQGKKETTEASKGIMASLVLLLGVSLLFTAVVLVWLDPILLMMGATEDSLALAHAYGLIVLAGSVFSFLTNFLNPVIRSDGAPIFAMVAQGSGAVANIILDPLFIYVFHWGLAGAAYATIIGQALSAALSIGYLCKSRTFRLSKTSFSGSFRTLGKTLRLGVPSFFIQISLVFVTVASNLVLVKYGADSIYGSDIPVAVFGITYKVFTIVVNIPIGIALGGLPIIGYNYGAGQYDRVKETYKWVFVASLIVSAVAELWFEFLPMTIISLFGGGSDEYNAFAVLCFRIYLSGLLLTGVQRTAPVFFQALGKAREGTILSVFRDLVLLVPLTCLLPLGWGLTGFLVSAPIADVLSAFLSAVLLIKEWKGLSAKEGGSTSAPALASK